MTLCRNFIFGDNEDLSFTKLHFSHVSGEKDLGNHVRLYHEYQSRKNLTSHEGTFYSLLVIRESADFIMYNYPNSGAIQKPEHLSCDQSRF